MKKKQLLLPLDIQFFAEANATVTTDLGDVRKIDFVNRFATSIDELLQVLGVTRRIPLTQDALIQTYKWTTTLAAEQVGENEIIPLSKAKKEKDKQYTVPFNKYRKVVSAEAIHRHGYDLAVAETDNKILGEIQEGIKSSFYTFLATAPTKQSTDTLQKALSLGWAKAKTFFPGNPQVVSFVNAMDVAKWLGDGNINSGASTQYGFTLLKDFLNQNVMVFDGVPEGKVYTTAVENIIFASQDVSGNDLARAFDLTTDTSGLIGVTHSTQTDTASIETLAFEGSTLFAEILDGVVETSIVENPDGV